MARLIRAISLLVAVLALATSCLLASPGTALAKKTTTYAPPGNSGVNQYMEDIPTAGGSKPSSGVTVLPSGGSGGSGGSGSGAAISPSVSRTLSKDGKDGKAAAALAAATAADSRIAAAKHSKTSGSGASPAGQVIKTLGGSTGGGGLGALLPVILIGSLVIVSVLGVLRRRRTV